MFKLQRILTTTMMILSMIQKPNRRARFIVVHASSFVSTRRSTRLSKQQQHHRQGKIHDSKLIFGISTTTSSKKTFVTNTNFRQQQQSISSIQRLFTSSSSINSQNDTTTTTTTEKNPISKENNTLFQGMTHATSKYVTHYLAPDGNTTTVQDAIQSVIPSSLSSSPPMPKQDDEGLQQICHDLLSSSSPLLENMTLSTETSLPIWRFDPAYLPQKDGDDVQLTAKELLALGSIWFIPASSLPSDDATSTNVNRKKDDTVKPTRLTVEDTNKILHKGDYLRIHHHPRRFQVVNRYNWAKPIYSKDEEEGKKERNNSGITNNLPGLIVAENSKAGYIILNKPCGVPVHSTVDNVLECVSGAVGRMLLQRKIRMMNQPNVNQNETLSSAKEQQHDEDETKQKKNHQRKKKPEPLVYVATPQRLDISTSGLLVVATHKRFAAYFAQLLRMKTDKQLSILGKENNNNDDDSDEGEKITKVEVPCGVHKRYKCLVCLCPGKAANDYDTKGEKTSMV